MRNYFTLDGVDSRSMGVYISGTGTFNSPARTLDFRVIPGRNGALVGLERRLENVELTYPAFICRNFDANLGALRAFLLSRTGYVRLTDSYHPEEYRMAIFSGPLEVAPTPIMDAGQFDLTFHCKPQRFLLDGETPVEFTAGGTITNPTLFDAQPLIRVFGAGRLGIGSALITIADSGSEYTDIDCDAMDCFYGVAPRNSYVTFSGNDFPVLHSGNNGVELGSGIDKVIITPRWWSV